MSLSKTSNNVEPNVTIGVLEEILATTEAVDKAFMGIADWPLLLTEITRIST